MSERPSRHSPVSERYRAGGLARPAACSLRCVAGLPSLRSSGGAHLCHLPAGSELMRMCRAVQPQDAAPRSWRSSAASRTHGGGLPEAPFYYSAEQAAEPEELDLSPRTWRACRWTPRPPLPPLPLPDRHSGHKAENGPGPGVLGPAGQLRRSGRPDAPHERGRKNERPAAAPVLDLLIAEPGRAHSKARAWRRGWGRVFTIYSQLPVPQWIFRITWLPTGDCFSLQ